MVNRTIYYYLILFAIFLINFSLIPIVFQIIQERLTSNIPYISLICMMIANLIYLFIVVERQYYAHIFFYFVGLISLSIIIFLKRQYDKERIQNIIEYS